MIATDVAVTSATDPLAGSSATDLLAGSSATDLLAGTSATDPLASSSATDLLAGSSATDPLAGSSATDLLANSSATDPLAGSSATDPLASTSATTERQSRKCKRDPENWKKNLQQKARSRGESYVTRKGRTMPDKLPKPVDCTRCRFSCSSTISEERRADICRDYYRLANYDLKKQFICNLVEEEEVKRMRPRDGVKKKPKKRSRAYHLFSIDGIKKKVCQKFFCQTFSFSFKIVDTALLGKNSSGAFVGKDNRVGRPASNKTEIDRIKHVKAQFESFPKVLPHYCRKNSQKQYLSPELNIKQMFRLYRDEYCVRENVARPVKEAIYRQIFTNEFNLRCFTPKKD